MDNSENPRSFYNSEKHYATNYTGQSTLVPPDPLSGSSETVQLKYDAASAQGYDLHDPAIYLFEHATFMGTSIEVRGDEKDLRDLVVLGREFHHSLSVVDPELGNSMEKQISDVQLKK